MAYTTIDDPSAHFQIALHTGTGSSNAITNDGNSDLQPDLLWQKVRSHTGTPVVYDSTRGNTKQIETDDARTESTQSTMVTSFDSDGFTMGTDTGGNETDKTYVTWQWKANGGSTSSNTSGSITSTVQANTTAGFSIVSYVGTNNDDTVGHGLGVVPTLIIVKNRDATQNWGVYHETLGNDTILQLDVDNAEWDTDVFDDTTPTSTVFSIGGGHGISNGSSQNHIAYCFTSIQGYSKFGSYTGNGDADGPFVYTGFSPSMVIAKASSTNGDWKIFDNKRIGYNAANYRLYPNAATVETSDSLIDILSNGFKLKTSSDSINGSDNTVIYMAFAESPFVTSTGIPATGR